VDKFLKQLDELIARLAPQERADLAAGFVAIFKVLGGHGSKTITKMAFVKALGSFMLAHASDDVDQWKKDVAARAAKIGPHVGGLFQAL
jgi:hypothetical protein